VRRLRNSEIGLILVHLPTAIVILQVASFYALVGRARLALGSWPTPHHAGPSDLGFSRHHFWVWLGGLFSALTPFLLLAMSSAAAKRDVSLRHLRVAIAVFVLCYAGVAALWYVDPGSFGAWFLD
jgi:hypothetical protein